MSASRRSLSVHMLVLGLVVLSAGLGAQRGGGGGRSAGMERPETPTVFDSEELKIHFDAPEGSLLYTRAAPGRYKAVLVDGKVLRMDSTSGRDVVLEAKSSPNMSEADLKGYLSVLETNPPQAKLPGFKKVSLKTIKIGKHKDKEAIDFVYNVELDGAPKTFRQVAFVHGGNGFVFTCSSLQPKFGAADIALFGLVFSRLEFR
jgi:hypothetical protein